MNRATNLLRKTSNLPRRTNPRRSLNPHRVNMSSKRSLELVRASTLGGPSQAALHDSAEDLEAGSLQPAGKGQQPWGSAGKAPAPARRGFLARFRGDRAPAQSVPGASRWGASYPLQVRVLFERSLKTRRFETLSTQDLIQYLIVGVLAGAASVCQ